MKTLKFKYLKLKRREESNREIALFMVIAALCGWFFSGWWIYWTHSLRPYRRGGEMVCQPLFYFVREYEALLLLFAAGFAAWLFSLFFRKRRWEAGILCGVVFLLVSLIWSDIAGYR